MLVIPNNLFSPTNQISKPHQKKTYSPTKPFWKSIDYIQPNCELSEIGEEKNYKCYIFLSKGPVLVNDGDNIFIAWFKKTIMKRYDNENVIGEMYEWIGDNREDIKNYSYVNNEIISTDKWCELSDIDKFLKFRNDQYKY